MHLIDSHCHLDFPVFDADREAVMQRAFDKGIEAIVVPGTERAHWPRIAGLCNTDHRLHACYGLHPWWVEHHDESDLDTLPGWCEQHTAVAIGECGLDFRPGQASQQKQMHFFERQLSIASELGLPAVIHAVNATEQVIGILKRFPDVSGMMHSYSGSLEQARQLVDSGFYISLGARICDPNAKKLRRVAREISLPALLLETDAPDQPPIHHKGQRNEPAWLHDTLDALAKLREQSAESLAQATTANARRLFRLDAAPDGAGEYY